MFYLEPEGADTKELENWRAFKHIFHKQDMGNDILHCLVICLELCPVFGNKQRLGGKINTTPDRIVHQKILC